MGRLFWILGLVILFGLGLAGAAHADGSGSNLWDPSREVRICARPSKAEAAGVSVWAVSENGTVITGDPLLFFKNIKKGARIYVFDPQAPPSSGALLGLKCPARYQPNAVPPAVTNALLKEEAAKKAEATKKAAEEAANHKEAEKSRAAREKAAAEKAAAEKAAAEKKEQQERAERARLEDEQGPHPKPELPSEDAEAVQPVGQAPSSSTPPAKQPGKPEVITAACQECRPRDPAKEPAEKKTEIEKLGDEMVHTAAILQLRMNEEKPADGKKYGIIGGKNPDGFNNPVAQVIAAAAIITLETVTAAGGFEKALIATLKSGKRFVTKVTNPVWEAAAEAMARRHSRVLADALRSNGAIGPYQLMRRFTASLGGDWQAHHILEVAMARKFGLGDPDLIPAVILTDLRHAEITKLLEENTKKARTVEELWAGYVTAYKDHPEWLEAIKSYFGK